MRRGMLAILHIIALAVAPAFASDERRSSLAMSSWAYQLQNPLPAAIARSGFDLVVVDYSVDGTDQFAFSSEQVSYMQRKPDGSRRFVLAYMSVGEAEDYRFYWQPSWRLDPPDWLGPENPDWKGNYKVHYWNNAWQRLLSGSPEAYIDKIVAAGFDGVYLDGVDAFEYFEEARPDAEREMVQLVTGLARYARSIKSAFLIVAQNGEQLLAHPDYLAVIDAIAKEDLFYGYNEEGVVTPPDETSYSAAFVDRALAVGKPVLTVDYVTDRGQVEDVYRKARRRGYVPYATVRDLDRLTVNHGLDPPRHE